MNEPPEIKRDGPDIAAQATAALSHQIVHLQPETTEDPFGAVEVERVFEHCGHLTGSRHEAAPLSAAPALRAPDVNSWDAQIAARFRAAGFVPTARSDGTEPDAPLRSGRLEQGIAALIAVLDEAESVGNQRGAASLNDALGALAALLYLLQRPSAHGLTAKACALIVRKPEPVFHRRVQRWSALTGIPAPGGRSTIQRARIAAGMKAKGQIASNNFGPSHAEMKAAA